VANQYAAIPSFHFGWTAVIAAALWRSISIRPLRLLVGTIPLLMFMAIIVTGNHLWMDAAVALVIMAGAHHAASQFDRTRLPCTIRGWLGERGRSESRDHPRRHHGGVTRYRSHGHS
jgi:hypothetical protein